MFQVDLSHCANVVSGSVFVIDGHFQDSTAPSVFWNADVDCLVPDDGGLFFSCNDLGSVLLTSAVSDQLENDVVFHGAEQIVTLLKES